MSNQICLKWNSFLNNIATSFESLWEEEGLVDVTLASDGQCLTAHKVILSASSPFFKKVFQTNPCRHPVIILQDVRFRELEALLIFIYKGEVNIEQQNLPALLKAAETLKIRGLSGGDVFANQSYKRFVDLDVPELTDDVLPKEETPKKKQKVSKKANNSILEKALTPQVSQLEITNDSVSIEATFEEVDPAPDPVLLRLEMKAEPLELSAEDFGKRSPSRKESSERLDTGQSDPTQGSGNSPAEDISGLSGLSGLSGISGMSDEKPVLYAYQRLPYANLLPTPDIIGTWASSRPMDHLACDLMKILFTPEERILCNVNGKMGKQQFDGNKIHLIREVLLHFSGIVPDSPEWDEAWKNCVTKIDTSNRGSSQASLTVIAEARDVTMRDERQSQSDAYGSKKSPEPRSTSSTSPDARVGSPEINSPSEIVEPLTFPSDHNPSLSQPAFPSYTNSQDSTEESRGSNSIGGPTYPPFPCPFCDRAYTSWGFRRRHIKAVHTISPTLNCKWCLQVLPTHAAWRRHVVSAHNLSASDAHNGLLILEEAHMVLQIARPTRLDALVNIIKESSRQNTPHDSTSDKDKE